MAGAARYLRVIGSSALQGAFTAAWYAAADLPPAKRRVARAGVTLTAMAAGWKFGDEEERPARKEITDGRGVAVTVASVGVGVALMVGGRALEKRWLAGLRRKGYRHPNLALGVRMALLTTAGTLPAGLMKAKRQAG